MGPFHPLVSVRVEHDYFRDGRFQALRFEPTRETAALAANANLLVRFSPGTIHVFYDETRRDTLRAYAASAPEPLSLAFKARSTDPAFATYSALPEPRPGAVLYFDNFPASVRDGVAWLHAEANAAADQPFEFPPPGEDDEPASLSGMLSRADWHLPPLFVVNVYLYGDGAGPPAFEPEGRAREGRIRFAARTTSWKYYLLGRLRERECSIVDRAGEVQFEALGNQRLADGSEALAFRSRQLLALRERSAHHFACRDAAGGELLIERLPVAGTRQIDRETVDNQHVDVSPIYVNG